MFKKTLRMQAIITDLKSGSPISIHDLAEKYQVSEMTIRRDIRNIEEQHLADLNSSASPINSVSIPATGRYIFDTESSVMTDAKRRIGAYAASLVEPDDILMLDTGTTVQAMVDALPADLPLTIICYNSNIYASVYQRTHIHLVLAGGYYHHSSRSFESPENVRLLERLRANKMFVSTSGVDRLGLTCSNQYEVVTKQTAIRSSQKKILLCDSSKFGKIKSSNYSSLEEMDAIISDKGLADEWIDYIRSLNLELTLV